ncbi:UDP-2,3-diacylglucosamine diphosphatase [Massilia antarctica]|uniref:UDP-2,3-diacylglucosamine diphosphatase n=1 Tax=Massilia antarctica TaxID=2765360 RepID=UPI0006BB7FA6|nr:UDP-2,3-diacylglucosamine diphosphatase [Massilia sp. H27-R4]MCY0910683.1 UDP-2,3-diacylglucosamine diphosphatase [Massilia sp. H27-R4]CUI08944.1 UDP-2,3-diacylglucosamine diphosphatase [Janthinobacterium sp. CG23_2]CUU32730.1 UDP-2,3-diacylglucosamine diphosphatase [Janthinobacterium sp. CG23_2]
MTLPARTLALFISDLHLQAAHARTVDAFFAFLEERAMAARALYILGDLFEYWAGDDDLDAPLHRKIAAAIRAVRDAGIPVYWIAGNRDFLVGQAFADTAGMELLAEPHIADIGGQRIALVHGDAECTDDIKYMEFRKQVRQPAWQAQFLAMPLAQRKAIIANLREGSKEAHSTKTMEIMDVTPQAIDALFAATGTKVMIHGHTHRPALHEKDGKRRYVLPDWEPDGEPPRGGWIAIGEDGTITRHDLDGKVIG